MWGGGFVVSGRCMLAESADMSGKRRVRRGPDRLLDREAAAKDFLLPALVPGNMLTSPPGALRRPGLAVGDRGER